MNRRKKKLLYIRQRNALGRGEYRTSMQVTNELLESAEESVIEGFFKEHSAWISRKFKCKVKSESRFLEKWEDYGGRILNVRTVIFNHRRLYT